MSEQILVKEQLEALLQKNWATIINRTAFMKQVLSDAQNAESTEIPTMDMPPSHTKISVTKVSITEQKDYTDIPDGFDLWTEFTVPRAEGVMVGTHIYHLSLCGYFCLKESFVTHFVPQSSVD